MMRLRILAFVSALLAGLTVSGAVSYAQAPAWPTRSVRFIVPFGPGAAADIGARLFAENERSLKQYARELFRGSDVGRDLAGANSIEL